MNKLIKPILFNTEMVQAILDDRKTVTRRLIKRSQCVLLDKKEPTAERGKCYIPFDSMTDAEYISSTFKPPYQKGDILYVRETWAFMKCINCDGDYRRPENDPPCYDTQAVEYDDGDSISDGCFIYRAGCRTPERITWRPSIHMPKEAARIWLRVTDVRVERLQDITHIDIIMEGVKPEYLNAHSGEKTRNDFSRLWDSTINKSKLNLYGWKANPWVWVIEFERCEKPEGWCV